MSRCPVLKECGSCTMGNLTYISQLEKKQEYVQKLFGRFKVEPVIGMKDPMHYRHKVYASFGYGRNRKVIAGMYAQGSHRIVQTDNCMIQNEEANAIIRTMCTLADEMHIEPYDEDRHHGVLRHVYLRVSHYTGEILVVIVIGSRELPGSREYVRKLILKHPKIASVVLNYNSSNTSMVLGKKEKVLYGPGYIEDVIGEVSFNISAQSFYQVNPVQTAVLYQTALDLAGITENDIVLDAFCGIGTISLLAAKRAKQVFAVEINPEAVKDAIANAKRNKIRNARFYAEDAEKFIEKMSARPDIAFLDPPRSGSTERFLKILASAEPEKIVYISCNPETLVRDLKVLKKYGYRLIRCIPVDMFPNTRHIETIVLLQKLNS